MCWTFLFIHFEHQLSQLFSASTFIYFHVASVVFCVSFPLDKDTMLRLSVLKCFDLFTSIQNKSNVLICFVLRWTEKASFNSHWFCKHHPFSISSHNKEDRVPPLPKSTKHLSLKINYLLKLVSLKTLKSWPFKAFAAFAVVQCTIHNELYYEGHDKWIFLCLLLHCSRCLNT